MKERKSFVYAVYCPVPSSVKFGFAYNPQYRLSELQVSNPSKLLLIGQVTGRAGLESKIHLFLDKYHIRGEWFRVNSVTNALMDIFRKGDRDGVEKYMLEYVEPDNRPPMKSVYQSGFRRYVKS